MFKYFWRDFRLLKLTFALITFYLLLDEIIIFSSKPTITTKTRAYLGPEHFPDIKICPFPSFRESELMIHGYVSSYDFALGSFRDPTLRGWFGNNSDWNISVSTLSEVEDCPSVKLKFKKDNNIVWDEPELVVTRVVHPAGRCCEGGIAEQLIG